jgi:hypothetical protein
MTTNIDLAKCISYLRPNDHWALSDNDYDRLEWLSETTPPTLAELESVWDEVEALRLAAIAKVEADKATAQAKLAALGLTADDLKALGL